VGCDCAGVGGVDACLLARLVGSSLGMARSRSVSSIKGPERVFLTASPFWSVSSNARVFLVKAVTRLSDSPDVLLGTV
jgi:hypothetical protein